MNEPGVEQRRVQTDVFTNVRIRRPVKPRPHWLKVLTGVGHAVGAAVLLAAGTFWTIRQQHPKYMSPGAMLHLPPAVITATAPWLEQPAEVPTDPKGRAEVFRVSHFLRAYTSDTVRAERIAGAIVIQSQKRKIPIALLVGVVLTEDAKLDPRATSSVGARGLMQVMPFHAGKHGCGSNDLFDVDANICYGASVLQQLIKRSPSIERALLHYNGCVHGTNTPNCHTYSGKVLRYAEQAATKML